MQKFYQRLKENQKERARCAFLVLYFGVLAVLLMGVWGSGFSEASFIYFNF